MGEARSRAKERAALSAYYSSEGFEADRLYAGHDLGAAWTAGQTTFRVWAPTASSAWVNLYAGGAEGADDLIERVPMRPDAAGTWVAERAGDLNGTYYTYTAVVAGRAREAVDPYARAVGVNGRRGMVIDLAATDPEGWDSDRNPHEGRGITDAVIYELHLRDLSSDPSAGIARAGKYLGLTERGAATPGGEPTGLDHIRALGVTHVHLLPVFDFGSVDEARADAAFNWGYDPANFNAPEGSYATDPYRGDARVREMKRMVKALHDAGLSVVMDVVYNHVYDAEDFCFNRLAPGYFSRVDGAGAYASGSGCGNDTATERGMVRRYIVDSARYWAEEYHIDGFRFDLVGLMDVRTVNEVIEAVRAARPGAIFYGEGWAMDTALTMPGVPLATQHSAALTPGLAYFNDTVRNAIRAWAAGQEGLEETVRACFMGVNGWCPGPAQSVNYVSCHDNLTLMDHLTLAAPGATREDRIRMNNLAAAFCLTAQGVPFMLAGEEMLRSKRNPDGTLNENSYNAPDAVNSLKWATLDEPETRRVRDYYRGLIAFRRAHGALRLATAREVAARVRAADGLPGGVTAFQVRGDREELFVIFNPTGETRQVPLPEGAWTAYVAGDRAGLAGLGTVTGSAMVERISAMALVREEARA